MINNVRTVNNRAIVKRKNYSVRIDPKVMNRFKEMCAKHGFTIGKRIEISMLHDMKRIDDIYEI